MDISAITDSTSTTSSQGSNSSAMSGLDKLANEQTFLKLFVTQLKNQDPLNPQDGTQFVAQLAEFSNLEQALQMRQDLDSIRKTLSAAASDSTATSTSTSDSTAQTAGS